VRFDSGAHQDPPLFGEAVVSGHGRYNPGLVFEIGNSLREARLRQNLDFGSVEAGTKIRSKYVEALETERFEVLPGETYVKGFLRTYAEYLGLDGQLYVDEFNSRFASADETLAPASPSRVRRERHRVGDSNFVVVALAAIVAVTILVVVAFGFGNGDPPADPSISPRTTESSPSASTSPTTTGTTKKPRAKAKVVRLVLTAVGGDCWLSVRAGGARGEQIYTGTLEQGQRLPVTRKRIWLQLGQPAALKVTLNGFRVSNFPTASGAIVVVTRSGVRQVSVA
jgi:cytoskeleton protein RodZ